MYATIFKFAYQLWHTMTEDDVKAEVVKGSITVEQFEDIVGHNYSN